MGGPGIGSREAVVTRIRNSGPFKLRARTNPSGGFDSAARSLAGGPRIRLDYRPGEPQRGRLPRRRPSAGRRFRALGGNLWQRMSGRLPDSIQSIPATMPCTIGVRTDPCNALVHRTHDGELVVEIERAGPHAVVTSTLESAVRSIVAATAIQALCDESARIFRDLTGYDRVMVYRFDEAGHGEVCSETKKHDLEAFLGNRYPASDIPQIARRLYERNRVRVLADVELRARGPLAPPVAHLRQGTRHVAVLFAQRVADPFAIPQEHGRCGDTGRLVDGRRPALGTGVVPSLVTPSSAL